MESEQVKIGMWVKVVYEGEKFLGKVTDVKNGYYAVRCLERPFCIGQPQQFEKESQVIYYDEVYKTDVKPTLAMNNNRGWRKWTY